MKLMLTFVLELCLIWDCCKKRKYFKIPDKLLNYVEKSSLNLEILNSVLFELFSKVGENNKLHCKILEILLQKLI